MSRRGQRYKGGKKFNGKQSIKRNQKPSFHIFCEGKNTEPLYFNSFPISNIAHCEGYSQTKTTLVNTALKYKREQGISRRTKDQIWVVFDYDYDGKKQPGQKEDYNAAIVKAKANNMNVAFSNDSFELWYLLHFENCNAQEGREWINKRLSKKLGFKYDKDKSIAKKMYRLLLNSQGAAIERAQALYDQYNEDDLAHADKNPITTVHLLVQELNKYL